MVTAKELEEERLLAESLGYEAKVFWGQVMVKVKPHPDKMDQWVHFSVPEKKKEDEDKG